MKNCTRFIMSLCILALVASAPLYAASRLERGISVTKTSSTSFEKLYSDSYAVIIGVNDYDKWPSLEYAVKDARAIEERLKSLGFRTTILLDQHATRENIVKILGDELPQWVQKNDRVIIFFAGHGQTEELADGTQMGYIVPVDADTRNIFSTAISMDQVRAFSRRLQAKHVLYLIDSCYAGLGLTRSGTIPPSELDYLQKITNRRAHQMLTAGSKGELVHEEAGHGVFTKYVLEALEGAADREGKGFITFTDMASYVKPRVSRYTRAKQIPQYGSIEGEGEFVFVLADGQGSPIAESSDLERDRLRIAEEKKRLEADKAIFAAERAQMEEQKRFAEEQKRLEAEKRRFAEEQLKLREEKENLDKQKAQQEAQLRAGEQRREAEKKLLSEDQAKLQKEKEDSEKQKARQEAQRRAEQNKEAEKRRISEDQARLRKEKEELERQKKETQRQVAEQGKVDENRTTLAMAKRPEVLTVREIDRDGRFIGYSDGTVLDTKTNLMWAAKDNGEDVSWIEAQSYCSNYRSGGYNDWRMPTHDELSGLYDEKTKNVNPPGRGCSGGYHLTNLIHLSCGLFWTSMLDSNNTSFSFSYQVGFFMSPSHLGTTHLYRVLPVRSVK